MVVADLENDVAASVAGAIDDLSAGDVAIVQHEYGLYGGVDGDEVLEIMRGLTVPVDRRAAHRALDTDAAPARGARGRRRRRRPPSS